MKIILKDGKILLPVIPTIRLGEPIQLDTQYIKDPLNKEFKLRINGNNLGTIQDFKFSIPKEFLLEPTLNITITEKIISNGNLTTFSTEGIPSNVFVYLGKTEAELFPRVIQELLYRVNQLEIEIDLLKSEGDII